MLSSFFQYFCASSVSCIRVDYYPIEKNVICILTSTEKCCDEKQHLVSFSAFRSGNLSVKRAWTLNKGMQHVFSCLTLDPACPLWLTYLFWYARFSPLTRAWIYFPKQLMVVEPSGFSGRTEKFWGWIGVNRFSMKLLPKKKSDLNK